MDEHPLKEAQKRIQDADQMAKSSPFLLPVVFVTTVMIFVIGLFVLYQAHGNDVEEWVGVLGYHVQWLYTWRIWYEEFNVDSMLK